MLAIYVRTSTTNNEDSLPAQEAACCVYAERQGYDVGSLVFSDAGVSGRTDLSDRPGLSEALTCVKDGRAQGLIVHRLDRLARELHVQEAALAHVWQAGGRVHEATNGEVLQDDPDDPYRTAMRQMAGVFSQLERGMINARLRGGRRRKKEQGGYNGGWTVPVGKRVEGTGKDARLVDDEAGIRLRDYAQRLRRDERMSFNAIAGRLNAEHVPTPRGGRWHATTVQRLVVSG